MSSPGTDLTRDQLDIVRSERRGTSGLRNEGQRGLHLDRTGYFAVLGLKKVRPTPTGDGQRLALLLTGAFFVPW